MRFVLMARADEGQGGSFDRFAAELVRAGVLLAAEVLEPPAAGARLRFDGKERILESRPAEHSVTGVWVLETAGEEEAMEWARRLPLTRGYVEVQRALPAEAR